MFKTIFRYKKYVHEDPRVRLKNVKAIYPPPGNNIILPDWEVSKLFDKLGYGLKEYSDKFENMKDVMEATPDQLKKREIPARARRYLRMMVERLKRGVLTFEYLERRIPQINKKDH